MSIYIGNDLEDRLKILETEIASLKKYNEYHQLVHEIDHMLNLHVQSVSWVLAEFRHNRIVQSPHENYFNVCRQRKEK